MKRITSSTLAGAGYIAAVFVLGTIRVMFVAPAVGHAAGIVAC